MLKFFHFLADITCWAQGIDLPSPCVSNNIIVYDTSHLNHAHQRYVAVKGDSMTKTGQIRKRITKSLRYSLFTCLIFFILPLACNVQNGNNHLKSSNQTIKSKIKSADQTGISQPQGQPQQYVPHEVLVKFNPDTDPQTIARIQAELKLEIIRQFRSPNLYLMRITDGTGVETVIEKLEASQFVKYAEPNYVVKANQ